MKTLKVLFTEKSDLKNGNVSGNWRLLENIIQSPQAEEKARRSSLKSGKPPPRKSSEIGIGIKQKKEPKSRSMYPGANEWADELNLFPRALPKDITPVTIFLATFKQTPTTSDEKISTEKTLGVLKTITSDSPTSA